MSSQINCEKYNLLYKISALGLAVYDTILYLDTNDCPEARHYLETRKAEYDEAVALYESKYGYITHKGHPSEDIKWAWQLC